MKKNFFNIAMAFCIGLFASCSQEEIFSDQSGEVETVNVFTQLPENDAQTRALPGAEANHQLRCILEVWDKADNGTLITRIEKLGTEATGEGKLSFSFQVDSKVNYQCLLWADYIDSSTPAGKEANTYADKYYDTQNLKAIDFKVTDGGLFNNASTDAFCGVVDKNGTTTALSVTLKRPFTKVILKDKSNYINDCKVLGVKYNTPSGYNIATGVATTTKEVNATGLTPDGTNKTWFSTFIFASANQAKLEQDITMEITKQDDSTETKTIKGGQISLDKNVENDAEANFSTEEEVKIDVDIDGSTEDPNAPKVGQFVNKDGTFSDTYNQETAIGIVFATGGKTDTSNYGDTHSGKTIYGYAMALTSITRSKLVADANLPTFNLTGDTPFAPNDYSGFDYSAVMVQTVNTLANPSPLFTKYSEWLTTNSVNFPSNLSSWYIPSGTQIKDVCAMLFGLEKEEVSSVNSSFKKAYDDVVAANETDNSYLIDCGRSSASSPATYILSSCIATATPNSPAVVATICKDGQINSVKTYIPAISDKSQYNIRPVLTIFKGN